MSHDFSHPKGRRKSGMKIGPFDAADYLTSPEMIVGFLREVIASGTPAEINLALDVVERAMRRLIATGKQESGER
jgi:DNA-binding phage protein